MLQILEFEEGFTFRTAIWSLFGLSSPTGQKELENWSNLLKMKFCIRPSMSIKDPSSRQDLVQNNKWPVTYLTLYRPKIEKLLKCFLNRGKIFVQRKMKMLLLFYYSSYLKSDEFRTRTPIKKQIAEPYTTLTTTYSWSCGKMTRSASRFSRNFIISQQLLKYSRILTTPPTPATRWETGVGKFIIVYFLSDSKQLSRFIQDDVLRTFHPSSLWCPYCAMMRWWRWFNLEFNFSVRGKFRLSKTNKGPCLLRIRSSMHSPMIAVALVTTVSFACVILVWVWIIYPEMVNNINTITQSMWTPG